MLRHDIPYILRLFHNPASLENLCTRLAGQGPVRAHLALHPSLAALTTAACNFRVSCSVRFSLDVAIFTHRVARASITQNPAWRSTVYLVLRAHSGSMSFFTFSFSLSSLFFAPVSSIIFFLKSDGG